MAFCAFSSTDAAFEASPRTYAVWYMLSLAGINARKEFQEMDPVPVAEGEACGVRGSSFPRVGGILPRGLMMRPDATLSLLPTQTRRSGEP